MNNAISVPKDIHGGPVICEIHRCVEERDAVLIGEEECDDDRFE